MDESVFGDLDEMALPELPDSVWMRLLANALDPDAPPVGLDLIPVDQPTDGPVEDDVLLDDGGFSDTGDGVIGDADDSDDSDDGSDSLPHHGALGDLAGQDHEAGHAGDHGWDPGITDVGWHHGDDDPYAGQ